MSELQRAMQIIAGTDQMRGTKSKVAQALGIKNGAVTHWFKRGFGGDVAVTLWKATKKQANLIALVEEGEALKQAA